MNQLSMSKRQTYESYETYETKESYVQKSIYAAFLNVTKCTFFFEHVWFRLFSL